MAAETESSLIAILEAFTSTPTYPLFSDFLLPFSHLPHPPSQTLTRSLAKQFLPFLNRSLSILRKRLSRSPPNGADPPDWALDLFDIYRLCLDCLESVSSQLSGKPFAVYLPRVVFLGCLEVWGFYGEARREGFGVLEKLRVFAVADVDAELATMGVDVVRIIVECTALGQCRDGGDYVSVIGLVQEAKQWFRVLDANAHEKLQRMLNYLRKCTLFLVGELMNFDEDVVRDFCMTMLDMHAMLSMKDQVYKFAHQICSSLFLLRDVRPLVVCDILRCVLESPALRYAVEVENWATQFLDLVSYAANKCRTAGTFFCCTVAEHLNKLAGNMSQVMRPLDLILRLYATGLSYSDFAIKSKDGDVTSCIGTKDGPAVSIGVDDVGLCNLPHLLHSVNSYFCSGCKENCLSSGVECEDSASQLCSLAGSLCGNYLTCTSESKKGFLLSYLNALKFLCQLLAELVNSEKKQIAAENDAAFVCTAFCGVQEVFHHFCGVFLSFSSMSEGEGDGFDEANVIPSVAVAAFTLSIRTKFELKRSAQLIKRIIASKWIQPQGLRHMLVSLYNIGVVLYRNNKLNEASKALSLCCRASWTRVILLCRLHVQNSNGLTSDVSEDAILDFVTEASTQTAFLLDVLHQCGSHKMKKVVIISIENWSIAEDLCRRLPGPMPLLKKWVKIECKLNKNDVDGGAQTLYSLLSSSVKASKRTVGKILQQELLAYEEIDPMYPELCQRMQMKIVDVLLQEVYVTEDSYFQKSRILLSKGRALRALGLEGLTDSIKCLSEAISLMNAEISSLGTLISHQLAVAYCLRALCTHEAEPNSKQVFIDIKAALSLWLSIPVLDFGSAYDEGRMLPDGALLLLCNIIDFLSVKGSVEFHGDIYKLMIILFKWKNAPLEMWLPLLWESRRLSHALCVSPINDSFIMNLSGDFGEQLKPMDFWQFCLEGSPATLVGFQQNFSYLLTTSSSDATKPKTSHLLNVTVDEVKKAAFELLSCVPVTSCSIFLAGYLYYDLCERLIGSGRLFEALLYAKEAHRLRTKLFQENFTYSFEQQVVSYTEAGHQIQKVLRRLCNLHVDKSIAVQNWSFDTISWDLGTCYLSPCKVLQNYLESTLQVGIIHEMIGNGVEAETYLQWGKDISCSQNLPLFTVAFSSTLGQLYRKKQSWDLSKKELLCAKSIFDQSCTVLSCLKCRLILEATVDQQLGDLYRSRAFCGKQNVSIKRLARAESLYKSALDKLNSSEWKNSVSFPDFPEEVVDGARNVVTCPIAQLDTLDCTLTKTRPKEKMEGKRCRKTKNKTSFSKEQSSTTELNTRLTRSRYRSSHNQNVNSSTSVQTGQSKLLKEKNVSGSSDASGEKDLALENNHCMGDVGCEITCTCKNMKCWFYLAKEVKDSGLVHNFILMKWEFVRRKLSFRVLVGIGRCLEFHGQIHEAHEIIFQSISVLVNRNSFTHTVATPFTSLLDLVGKELPQDIFVVERAALLYYICWFSLKGNHSNDIRNVCCALSNVQTPKIISLLMVAFVLCRQVPMLLQKVSRLLSALFIVSSSENFPLPFSSNMLTTSHWASYFHQASVGTHLNSQFFSKITDKCKSQQLMDNEGSCLTGSSCISAENLPRLAPESVQDLEQFVTDYFLDLPCTTVICISMIGGPYACLLQDLLRCPSRVCAWIQLSRFNFQSQPIVLLLPVDLISEEPLDFDGADSVSEELFESNGIGKRWRCPWGFSVVDEVAPAFKLMLEENYLSSSIFPLEDTKISRKLWWTRRKKIDCRFGRLLRKLEDSWLGPWRYVLLGEWPNCKRLDSVQKKLMRDLKTKCKLHVNESFLKVILAGAECGLDKETCILHLLSIKSGCFIGQVVYSDEEKCETLLKEGDQNKSGLAIQLLVEALNELEEEESVDREPVILVLDNEVQMLPWENLPTLRNQEVYRMPSVGSITLTLKRNINYKEQVERIGAAIPFIDPVDAFYLLNPSGDFSSTQVELENWFKNQNLEGKAGSAPTVEELTLALKSHDLFIYFDHGSGEQYVRLQEIQKLKNCAAAFLMGCSSGSLSLNGPYIPHGAPLSYLLAGSPVIVANLWEVTDKDIDRFGKAVLDAWLKERLSTSTGCVQCNLIAKKFDAMTIRGGKRNAKKKFSNKKVSGDCDSGPLKDWCDHGRKIGSFLGRAREACELPYLIGASPVCYGVPTGIRRKKDL